MVNLVIIDEKYYDMVVISKDWELYWKFKNLVG